uniref:Uncharacterized protein n=1 Tax=Anguilla anguilla TaxID=7936 RepID=A0A0E9S3L4_ANGAN
MSVRQRPPPVHTLF